MDSVYPPYDSVRLHTAPFRHRKGAVRLNTVVFPGYIRIMDERMQEKDIRTV